MFVCCCNAVTDETVRAAIDAGAHTVEAVTAACGAGGDCGACHPMIEELIEARTGRRTEGRRSLPIVRAA